MTRARAAYALRCPGQSLVEEDAFGLFPAILACNIGCLRRGDSLQSGLRYRSIPQPADLSADSL